MSADNLISIYQNKYAKEPAGALTIADFVRQVRAEEYASYDRRALRGQFRDQLREP